MKFINQFFIGLIILALASCNKKKEGSNQADTIYFGGDILTMQGEKANYAEALAIKDGKILFVGSKSEVEKFQANSNEMKNLDCKTTMPKFG